MRAIGLAATLAIATASSVAAAQPVRPLVPIASSDTLTLPDARDAHALSSLRLGLMSSAVPHAFGTAGCEPAGYVTGLSPMPTEAIAASGVRLWRKSDLRLTLFGFSRDGCALDALVGGGLAFTLPIKKDVMFMWGGGAIYLPHGGPNGAPRSEGELRAGIVWTTRNGNSYTVGISARNGGPHVSLSGVF